MVETKGDGERWEWREMGHWPFVGMVSQTRAAAWILSQNHWRSERFLAFDEDFLPGGR